MPSGRPPREQRTIGGVVYLHCSQPECDQWKPCAEFYRAGRGDGRYFKSRCKVCVSAYESARRLALVDDDDDDAQRLARALAVAPRVTQVLDGKRIRHGRDAPFCLIPTTHAAYLPRLILSLFVPNDRWPLAAD